MSECPSEIRLRGRKMIMTWRTMTPMANTRADLTLTGTIDQVSRLIPITISNVL